MNKLWSICLTKYKLAISCPLNTRADPHATQFQSPISSCHSKYMRIIENRQRGTPCTWYKRNPITKMTRQVEHEHLNYLFIYYVHRFLLRMLHIMLIMAMQQVSTMIRHGLGYRTRCFSNTKYITPWTYKLPLYFTLVTSIDKRA